MSGDNARAAAPTIRHHSDWLLRESAPSYLLSQTFVLKIPPTVGGSRQAPDRCPPNPTVGHAPWKRSQTPAAARSQPPTLGLRALEHSLGPKTPSDALRRQAQSLFSACLAWRRPQAFADAGTHNSRPLDWPSDALRRPQTPSDAPQTPGANSSKPRDAHRRV